MAVWLTQITPDLRDAKARRDLRDAIRMHRRIMSLAPEGLGTEARRQAGVLYRIEETPGGARILVQTAVQPVLSGLPDGYGTIQTRNLGPLLEWLHPGAVIRYRLAANTCLRKSHDKKVVPLRGAEADKWWLDRAPGCGLSLKSIMSHSPGDVVGSDGADKPIRHALTQFDGIALIADPATLATAITTGIGRGKSHGCGLLSIAPVRTAG